MRIGTTRVSVFAVVATAFSSVSFGYYPWTFFANRTGSAPVSAKFDVNALPGKTVSYFISSDGPTSFVAGDSYSALLSEIRAAAEVWNGVKSSDLRIAFGGISSAGSFQTTPGIDVIFTDEIPPGLLAQTRQ